MDDSSVTLSTERETEKERKREREACTQKWRWQQLPSASLPPASPSSSPSLAHISPALHLPYKSHISQNPLSTMAFPSNHLDLNLRESISRACRSQSCRGGLSPWATSQAGQWSYGDICMATGSGWSVHQSFLVSAGSLFRC